MRRIAFDTETHLIKPGQLFPRLVCVSFAEWISGPGEGGIQADLLDRRDGVRAVLAHLADPDVILIGHNVPYDLGVIAAEAHDLGYDPIETNRLIWVALDHGAVADTMTRGMLLDIARGAFQEYDSGGRNRAYSLQAMTERYVGRVISKADTWRLHYAALTDVPIAQWPADARQYAIDDACATLEVDDAIMQLARQEGSPDGRVPDEERQVRAAWVLHLMAGWGVRVDAPMVQEIKRNLEYQVTVGQNALEQWQILKPPGKNGKRSKSLKRLRELIAEGYQAQGKEPPRSAKTQAIKTGADEARASGHPAAIACADMAGAEKLLSTYVPPLERGALGTPITSRPNVLVASGRTSWGAPNWQNPPRIGGIRECVVPRAGRVLCAADLDTVELRALAQCCLEIVGWSEMAGAIQRGEDLHLALGAEIVGIDYARALALYQANDARVSDARQAAKAANFGFPGGMGARKFRLTQLESRPDMTEKDALDLREAWFKRWPEMREYLKHAGRVTDEITGSGKVAQPWSGRVRGGLDYCSAANTLFQGRVADGCKLALWRLSRAMYCEPSSVLFGSRLVLFLHDEIIFETDEDAAHLAAAEAVRILCGAVQEVIPQVPITSSAVLMRRWYKGAKPVHVSGRLVPCKPVVSHDATGKKRIAWEPDMIPLAA